MRTFVKYLFCFACIFASADVHAQDPHYTQAHRIPSWYNPAAAGHGVEHIRLTLLYRNQWSSVMSPFKTQGLFFDKQVGKVGFGANLVNNSSGEAGIRQFYLNGQISYRYAIGKSVIASGLQLGMIQKSFDPSKMTFDDQYTPDQGFDPSNPTSETFSYTKLTRPDIGAGVLWTYGFPGKDKLLPYAGISLQHINQPKESFIEDNNYTPRKITLQSGVGIILSEALTLTPMLTFAQQQNAKELMGGIVAKMPLDGRDNVEGGILFRNKDAVALYAGYQWNNFMMGMSYDVNISGLTGGPGAFELTLTYIPKAKEKKENKKKEKDKKQAPKSKTSTSTKPRVPVSGSKVNAPAPTSTSVSPEKKTAATPPNKVPENKSTIVNKPNVTSKTTVAPKTTIPAPTPTKPVIPSKTSANTAEHTSMTKASVKTSTILPIAKSKLEPKKNTTPANVGKQLPYEEREIITINPLQKKTATIQLPVTVVQDVKNIQPIKTTGVVIHQEEEISIIASIPVKPLPTSVKTNVAKGEVKNVTPSKTNGKVIHTEEELSVIASIPVQPLPTSVKTNVAKLEITNKVKLQTAGIPIVTEEEYHAKLPTLIPAPTPVLATTKDSDGDGIIDSLDPCPYLKGSATSGGCPDTDGDGITDMNDRCPLKAGSNTNGGCPEENTSVEIGSTSSQHFGNIEFKTSSAEVHGLYKLDIIEPALDSIFIHDDLILVLTGHTDSEGDGLINMQLSQDRADAVKAIFIRKGMPEVRIQTVTYGETMPIKDNVTEEGKKHNRRVEVHVIRRKNL